MKKPPAATNVAAPAPKATTPRAAANKAAAPAKNAAPAKKAIAPSKRTTGSAKATGSTKSPAKKAPATKSPAKKSPAAKKALATKAPAKKSPAAKAPATKSPATKSPAKPRSAAKPKRVEPVLEIVAILDEPALSSVTFGELGLPADLVTALADAGIERPFPVQELCIPPALEGRDVCGKAKTGSGKTLAFGLPLLVRVRKGASRRPRALVLVPTRELALQVHDVIAPLCASVGRKVVAVYGGAPMERQIKALRNGVDIVVATPGRLIDLGDRGDLDVSDVEFLVLDEADRMADMGFMPQVEWVLRRLPSAHQTLLFSATLDGDVDHLRRQYLTDPLTLEVESVNDTVDQMEHRFIGVHQLDKVKVLEAISRGVNRTLVFVRTKRGADRLVEQLERERVKAAAIHGDLRQVQRERALSDFQGGKLEVLVATDVAARGIHVDGIDVVVHYDPPEDHKSYLHRSGRTARAGEAGLVVTLVLWDQRFEVEMLQKRIGIRMPLAEMLSNDRRLLDLRSFDPGTVKMPSETAAEAAIASAVASVPAAPVAATRGDEPAAPINPAVAAAQAVMARKAAQRAMGGRRRGRR